MRTHADARRRQNIEADKKTRFEDHLMRRGLWHAHHLFTIRSSLFILYSVVHRDTLLFRLPGEKDYMLVYETFASYIGALAFVPALVGTRAAVNRRSVPKQLASAKVVFWHILLSCLYTARVFSGFGFRYGNRNHLAPPFNDWDALPALHLSSIALELSAS